jgi:hypothetical protein
MYAARVHGCKANMTVALYQGDGAVEVHLRFSRADPIFISLHSDGGRMSHDIQAFGESVHPAIPMN